jgi:hypothetical protein
LWILLGVTVMVMAFFMMLISRVSCSFEGNTGSKYNSFPQCLWFRQGQLQF